MQKYKKALSLLLTVLLLLPFFCIPTDGATAPLALSAKSALLMEADSGRVLWAHGADEPLPMASTTKIMTALVALELAAPDTAIPIPASAVGVEGSSVYLVEGEVRTLEELLYALLLESANDAAAAIAIGLSGSIEDFAKEMNATAVRLGLSSTHFTNPHGLSDEEHYTTAYELALITQAALRIPLIAEIVATRKFSIPHPTADGVRVLINHNRLLRTYEGCIGVKTGFTKQSGRCLVSAAERDGVRLIAVTLHASDDWKDHAAMLDYGFSICTSVSLAEIDAYRIPLPLVGSKDGYVLVHNKDALRITLPTSHGPIRSVVELARFDYAPLPAAATVGRVRFFCDSDRDGTEEEIGQVPLVTAAEAPARPVRRGFWAWLRSLFQRK